MYKVLAFFADGFEEVEALAVVDLLRRADVRVDMVSIMSDKLVTGAHNIVVQCDSLIEETDFETADMIFLPGGGRGAIRLGECKILTDYILQYHQHGKRLAAICAAPRVFGSLGILSGKNATCYPGFEDKLLGAKHIGGNVVTDGMITTSKGMGTSIDLGLELVSILVSPEESEKLGRTIQYK